MYKWILALHIISATIWAGGHLILSIGFLPKALKEKDVSIITNFENVFEKVGIPALIIQVLTGFYLAWELTSGQLNQWFDFKTFHGIHIGLKLFFLTMTLFLAFHARFRIIPKLKKENLNSLAVHIVSVTILAVLLVLTGVSFRVGGLL
ncbi:MAG: copper resistance protein CopD [Epsilonproteobacteria bacterium]|nr:MAG: copper resistance protein CopD [Campylobacterota bacterium]RLA65977.1 MAG: copper resistance protein CopD [Campylobacterota bacterium]